jgi:hypothetical protein
MSPWLLRYIKLTNGEEIISWMRTEDSSGGRLIILKNPMELTGYVNMEEVGEDEDEDEEEIYFTRLDPWIRYTDNVMFVISAVRIVVSTQPSPRFAWMFVEALKSFYGEETEAGETHSLTSWMHRMDNNISLSEAENHEIGSWMDSLRLGDLNIGESDAPDPSDGKA